MKIFRTYCDGACDRIKEVAALSFIVVEDNVVRWEHTDTFPSKSANEAEMRSVLASLDILKNFGGADGDRVFVYTNLKTIPDAFDKRWIQKWIDNDWKNSDGNDVRHRELWSAILAHSKRVNLEIRYAQKDEMLYFSRLKKRVRKAVRSFEQVLQ